MGEIRSPIQRINVPAILAASLGARAFFPENVVLGPALANARGNQLLRLPVSFGDEINVALVINVNGFIKTCGDIGRGRRNK